MISLLTITKIMWHSFFSQQNYKAVPGCILWYLGYEMEARNSYVLHELGQRAARLQGWRNSAVRSQ